MAASVLFACGLNDQKLPSFIHISEESNVDCSFLISCILGQRLRISNAGTLLICLQHTYQHYFHAGMRLGYNTSIFLGKTLNVIDPLTEMARDCKDSKWLSDGNQITSQLLDVIRHQIENNFMHRVNTTIIIDNISILLNLGSSKEDVLQLCYELAALTKGNENLTVVTKINNCDLYTSVNKNVAKLGDLHIFGAQLRSGMFCEVDGKLLVQRGRNIKSHKEILYKVNDRNIKVFNPGEIGMRI